MELRYAMLLYVGSVIYNSSTLCEMARRRKIIVCLLIQVLEPQVVLREFNGTLPCQNFSSCQMTIATVPYLDGRGNSDRIGINGVPAFPRGTYNSQFLNLNALQFTCE